MIKKISVILLLIFSATVTHAQIKFSAKAGPNFNVSDMSFSNTEVLSSMDNPMGFHAGLALKVKLLPIMYLQGDVLYKNSSYKFNVQNEGHLRYTNHTIDLPVSVGWQVIFLRVYAGPTFSFKLDTKEMKSIESSSLIENASTHNGYGYHVGVGFDIAKKVTIDFSYNGKWKSTTHVINVNNRDVSNTIKDRQLMVSIGYVIF